MLRCLSCGGVFEPVQADGTEYYHVCPPLSVAELTTAVAAGAVQLPPGENPDEAVRRRTYVRANARNENVTGPAKDDHTPAPIVSAGAGVVTVPDPVVGSVVVVDVPLPPPEPAPPVG